MRHSLNSYLLILLIVLQSVMAMADLHPFDQAQSLKGDLAYQQDNLDETDPPCIKNVPVKNSALAQSDCIDCIDCYCCFYLSFPTVDLYTPISDTGQLIDSYGLSMLETPRFLLLRPPKS